MGRATHRRAFPDSERCAGLLGGKSLALVPVVAPPGRSHLECLRIPVHGEGQAKRRGEHARCLGGPTVNRPIVGRILADRVNVVLPFRGDLLLARGKHPNEVAVAHATLGDLFVRATGGAKQVKDDQALKFGADGGGGGWGEDGGIGHGLSRHART